MYSLMYAYAGFFRVMVSAALAAVSCAAGAQTASPARPMPGVAVHDLGLDGDKRYFRIVCPDGFIGSVSHHLPSGQVCAYPREGNAVCQAGQDIDAAAAQSCAKPARR